MNKSAREKEAVLNVFASLVRPLTRVAFEYGISASEISGAVRRTYIQALEARLLDQKRATTDARLAVVAGLAKSDVTALREATRSGAPHSLRATVSLDQVTNLLTVWHTHSGFSGAYGLALELDLVSTPGSPRRSFRELINAACPGADGDALLDELVAAGSVEVIDGSTVRCLSRAYLPHGADVKRIERMGRFLARSPRELCSQPASARSRTDLLREGRCLRRAHVRIRTRQIPGACGRAGSGIADRIRHIFNRLAESERIDGWKEIRPGCVFLRRSTDRRCQSNESGRREHSSSSRNQFEEIDVLAGQ